MRRLLVIIAGIAVVPTGLACQHTAGKCDCLPPMPHCSKYGLYTPEMLTDIPAQKQEMLPPVPGKMVPAGVKAHSDVGEPIIVTPSIGVTPSGGAF